MSRLSNALPGEQRMNQGGLIMKPADVLFGNQPSGTSVELRIGLHSFPYLADHGFQDMIVLPGSCFIEMALRLDPTLSNSAPPVIKNVSFSNPVILVAEDTVLKVDVMERGSNCTEFIFYEAGAKEGSSQLADRHYAAKLEVVYNPLMSQGSASAPISIEAFQAQSESVIDGDDFYGKLSQNRNHYGPSFQRISSIWRVGDQCLGKLIVGRHGGESKLPCLDPVFLDSITQLMAPFILETGKTFVLRSVERIDVTNSNLPNTLWGLATMLPPSVSDRKELLGNVRVFDEHGNLYLELMGVVFSLLDRVTVDEGRSLAKLVIASNFTAEPIEDSLNFWNDHFNVTTQLEFAPYNQIFQQLLDRGSSFHRNRDGVNVVLLGLEEWSIGGRSAIDQNMEAKKECFGARKRYILPNGLEIVHMNQYETDYLYREIFEDECYLRHGICLRDGDTVVDVGANIGLFSLFVLNRCKNPKIFAFEPAPVVHDLLKANCDAYGFDVRVFNAGVSDTAKTGSFTFYEKSSVFSGFYSDDMEDREAIQAVVRNMLNRESIAGESTEEYVKELTADRLRRSTHECQLTTVSAIIRENHLEKIDLLKIDAEKSELDIIKGIEDGDWPKIKQLVMEIHDPSEEAVTRIKNLLIEKGYRCAVEKETLLDHAGLSNLYATRIWTGEMIGVASGDLKGIGNGLVQVRQSTVSLTQTIQDLCTALSSFMNQAKVPLIVCLCPPSPGVEADAELRTALNDAEAVLLSQVPNIANVHIIRSESLIQRYPITAYYDPHSRQVAHIPYTPECYSAIGTALVRTIYNLKRDPFKVIVLDCDNTLWKGVCGEDGPSGIELNTPYLRLQQFIIDQMKAGILLCLCSKNNEKDVLEVFEHRPDMLLKLDNLVSWRINWNSKSVNIKSLAKELNLGLDSFIFIDDNPLDCADVKINCPEVLTLQLPQNTELIPSFLDHIWAFDHTENVTEEDQNRTKMYQENAQRQRYLEQSLTLKDFIGGLQLRIEITEVTDDQLGRVSQQTFRTNQFNFTTLRRSENDIKHFLKQPQAKCNVVRVVDRFGDYGLVGVLMYEVEADRHKVDTFLLSCRVLGRGVEHAIVSWLGQQAVKEGKELVEFTYLPTGKNSLALEFITSIGDHYRNESGTSWVFPAEYLASVEYDADEKSSIQDETAATDNPETLSLQPALAFRMADRSERLQQIGENLHNIESLTTAIQIYRQKMQPLPTLKDGVPPTTLETALAGIWRRVLGRKHIGLNENFFEVGGTSLRAVQVIAEIKKELQQSLSIVSLFESPTVKLLADKLGAISEGANGQTATAAAALRGQQRRYNTTRARVL